jgi:membrane-bound lytic murein transglycosylase B
MKRSLLLLALLALSPVRPCASQAPAALAGFDLSRGDIQSFVADLVARHGFDREQILATLAKGVPQPQILAAISRPAEQVDPWWQYRRRFLTEERITAGLAFWEQHREMLDAVYSASGVAPEYVVAIIGVETFYGRVVGKWRVLDALMTLGFDYAPRAQFFRSELENFLLLARDEQIAADEARGSYAGAMGAPQFMPSSWRRFARDGGGDGTRNLFRDWDDIIASVANYFEQHGWQPGGTVLIEATADPGLATALDPRNLELNETLGSLRTRGVQFHSDLDDSTAAILLPAEVESGPGVRLGLANFKVITRYNRSILYAMAVHDLAQQIASRALSPDS